MALVPPPQDQWYVIHVLSGHEQKVCDSLKRRIETEEMFDCSDGDRCPVGRVRKIRLIDKKGSLNDLMRHLGGFEKDNKQQRRQVTINMQKRDRKIND